MRLRGGGLAFAVLLGGAAQAGPLYQTRFGGLTGDALHESPFSLYWNPAGLARPGTRLALHGSILSRQATYDRDAELNDVAPDEEAANAGEASISTLAGIPALAVGHGLRLDELDLGFAAGGFVLAAGAVDWDKNLAAPVEYPGAVDGPQRWATISTRFLSLAASAGLGARYRPWGLSIGVAPMYTWASLDTVRARNADRTDELVDAAGRIKEGRILLESEDERVLWTAGVRWEATPDLTVGVSYISGATYDLAGDAKISFGTAEETTEASHIELPLAQSVRATVAVRLGDFTLRPTVEWSDWSVMERQVALAEDDGQPLLTIERAFEDTFAAKLRADWAVHHNVTVHAGVGYETAATPEKTHEPGLAESQQFEAGAGVSVDFGEHVRLSSSFIFQQFADRRVTNSNQQPIVNGDYTDRREYLTIDLEIH